MLKQVGERHLCIWYGLRSTWMFGKQRCVSLQGVTTKRILVFCIQFCVGISWGLRPSKLFPLTSALSLIHCSRQLSQCRAEQLELLCGLQDALESPLQSIQLCGFQMDGEPGKNISGLGTQSKCLWERSD